MEKTVTINGMKCDGCKETVKKKLAEIDGVISVAVSLEDKEAVITSRNELSNGQLIGALSDTKFTIA